jgi:peptidoglycan/LPS O-acetylase OafA/YrhL
LPSSSSGLDKDTPGLLPGASLFLDVVRLAAALVVAFGHLTQRFFSSGWPNRIAWATNAVTVFFLLSGFVIRYVTLQVPATLRSYIIDRASRMYSVLAPALAFTILADSLTRFVNPGYYIPNFGMMYNHFFLRSLIHLTFTSQIWDHDITYLSNSPTWSLGYEWFYYIFYGFFFYLKGRQRVLALAVGFLVAGPAILILLPIWVAGCVLFEVYTRFRATAWLLPAVATVVTIASAALIFSIKARLILANAFEMLRPLFIKRASPVAYLACTIFFVLMLLGLLLADRIKVSSRGRTASTIRLLAEATFPLYLFHFPLFILLKGILRFSYTSSTAKTGVLLFAFAASVGLGVVLNRFKLSLRSVLRRILPREPWGSKDISGKSGDMIST